MRLSRIAPAALLLAACVVPQGFLADDAARTHDVSSLPIVNGDPPDAPEHFAVVALHQMASATSVYVSPFCSGTLITEDVVLTAAHCLDTANGGPNFKTMDPNDLGIYVGDDPSIDLVANLHLVDETLIHPSYNRRTLRNDIALVRLAAPVAGVAPVPHLGAAEALGGNDVGQLLDFAGFGYDDVSSNPNRSFGVKLHAEVALGGFGCAVAGCSGGEPATQISYLQGSALGGPCNGDSGGPAFVTRASGVYVAGITSYGDSACDQYGVSTRVDAFETFIDAFLTTEPPEPTPEPPNCSADGWCNPECFAGEDPDCAGGSSCGDSICGTGESCDGRYGTLSCAADCDGKTNGRPASRYCFVEGVCEGPGCP